MGGREECIVHMSSISRSCSWQVRYTFGMRNGLRMHGDRTRRSVFFLGHRRDGDSEQSRTRAMAVL